MKADAAKRLKGLEVENQRLKELIAEQVTALLEKAFRPMLEQRDRTARQSTPPARRDPIWRPK